MSRITLVNPQIAVSSWGAPFNTLDATSIRFALAYLSASLKKTGHEVKLIDLRVLKGWREYDALLKEQQPEFLGVTMHTCEFDLAIECCRRAKTLNPNIKTVVGGIHPTMYPQECLDTKVVDYAVKGEGEISFPKLVENPEAFSPSFRGETPDLDVLPFSDRELWQDYEKRIQYPVFQTFLPPVIEMLTKRGCPWQCRFCCGPGEQNLYAVEKDGVSIPSIRTRSVRNVMEELAQLYRKYRFRSIIFHDDQFVLQPKWAEDFCSSMHEYGFAEKGIEWWAASRADVIVRHPELFKKMKEAGLSMLSVGFESFSSRMLKWINKGTTIEQNWEAARILKELGIQIFGNFMFGVPYSDGKWHPEDDVETAKAISQIKPEIVSASFFTPIPGSYLHDFCAKNSLVLSNATNKLGLRIPNENKIRTVDYEFLNHLLSTVTVKSSLYGSLSRVLVNVLWRANLHDVLKDLMIRKTKRNRRLRKLRT